MSDPGPYFFKVIEIAAAECSGDFIAFLAEVRPSYRDEVLEEHLYGEDDLVRGLQALPDEQAAFLASEVNALRKRLSDNGCAYVRVVR